MLIQVKEIESVEELNAWKQQWQEGFSADPELDISSSFAFLANDWIHIRNQKGKLLIASNNQGLLGATITSIKTIKRLLNF